MDPIERFRRLRASAERAGAIQPEKAALATADRRGRPSVRYVLLRGVDERGFVFYTDGRSRKGADLRANPRAAVAVYWGPSHQVRIEGTVEEVESELADRYWAGRSREKRLAASASTQDAILRQRSDLLARFSRLKTRFRGLEIPRPADWTGFRIVPETVEFWTRRHHRLHHRELYSRRGRGWRRQLLQP